MGKTGGFVAWFCIFSTLLMSCYSSAIVDPKSARMGNLDPTILEYVVTTDSTRYLFTHASPQILEGSIVGTADIRTSTGLSTREVAIPLSDVVAVGVSEFQPGRTVGGVLGVAFLLLLLSGIVVSETL